MDYNQNQQFSNYTVVGSTTGNPAVASKTFMSSVFLWMFAALLISSISAYLFASVPSLVETLRTVHSNGSMSLTPFGMIITFAPLIFVLSMSFAFNRLSAPAMVGFFLLYAATTGISLSFILLVYQIGSVITTFASSAAMFGVMAVMGYTTNKDLTSFGRILMMGLIGIVIAMLVNMFMHRAQMDYIISIIGVAVFTGLTAYDVQKLKNIGAGLQYEGTGVADTRKLAIMGALSLYLDFINLFLMMLRLFGRRK